MVKVDGHDVRDVQLESLRSQIGMVMQETFLFNMTVRENISYGRDDVTQEEIEAAVTDPRLTRSPNKTCGRECKKGYQLETDSLGGDPILRRLKDNEVIRPMSANRNTIKAIEKRGLIRPGKGRGPLTIVWRLKNQGI